jgi:hypothetical protein
MRDSFDYLIFKMSNVSSEISNAGWAELGMLQVRACQLSVMRVMRNAKSRNELVFIGY